MPEQEVIEPIWIVNDIGELGVEINGQCYFLYKSGNIQYDKNDDGTEMFYRKVGKREFGEVCHPWFWYDQRCGLEEKYKREITNLDGNVVDYEKYPQYKWKPLPKLKHNQEN